MAAITIRNDATRDIRVSVPISLGDAQLDGGYFLLPPGQQDVWNRPASGNNQPLGATAFVVAEPFLTGKHPAVFYVEPNGQLNIQDRDLN